MKCLSRILRTSGSWYVVASITWHQWHHSAEPSSTMYLRSAFARANVSGESVAHGSSSRGAPSGISALGAVACPARAPLAVAGLDAPAPGPAAHPTASAHATSETTE